MGQMIWGINILEKRSEERKKKEKEINDFAGHKRNTLETKHIMAKIKRLVGRV